MANEQFDAKFMEYYKGFAGKAQGPFDSSEFYNGLADMYVLQQDKKRVWMDDTETVAKGNDVYAALLSEWSKISRGAF